MKAAPARSNHWAELDVLRALAGALMVANHAGVAWLAPGTAQAAVDHAAIFVGGLAPVVFFTVTGLGRGVQAASRSTSRSFTAALRRALVLFLADAALWLAPGVFGGLDFLGFIALSTLVLELVSRLPRPGLYAALGGAACLAVRYLIAPALTPALEGTALAGPFLVATGSVTLPRVSYMPLPWLAFPLLGYALGRMAASRAESLRSARARNAAVLAVIATLGFVVCALLARRGLIFFRWGTMSFAYAVFAFSALFAALALTLLAVAIASRATAIISLPGLASFVIVPVHYLVVAVAHRAAPALVAAAFPLDLVIFIPAVFAMSKGIASRITELSTRAAGAAWQLAALTVIIALLVGCAFVPATESSLARVALMAAVQLCACLLFAQTSLRRAAPAAEVPRLAPGVP